MNNDIKNMINEMNELYSINYLNVENEINYIINNNIISNKIIEKVFDELLDLSYWYGKEIDKLFYKLYNYYKSINLDVSQDYKKYYKKILRK